MPSDSVHLTASTRTSSGETEQRRQARVTSRQDRFNVAVPGESSRATTTLRGDKPQPVEIFDSDLSELSDSNSDVPKSSRELPQRPSISAFHAHHHCMGDGNVSGDETEGNIPHLLEASDGSSTSSSEEEDEEVLPAFQAFPANLTARRAVPEV
jgi:hypothetical protein